MTGALQHLVHSLDSTGPWTGLQSLTFIAHMKMHSGYGPTITTAAKSARG
jgi:hypothetical protein